MASRRQLQAVTGQRRRVRRALASYCEEIDKPAASRPGQIANRLGIELRVIVAPQQIRQRRPGLLKRHRREQDDSWRLVAELVQQFIVSAHELRQRSRALEGFHLAELGENEGRFHTPQLLLPGTKIHLPPLLEDG